MAFWATLATASTKRVLFWRLCQIKGNPGNQEHVPQRGRRMSALPQKQIKLPVRSSFMLAEFTLSQFVFLRIRIYTHIVLSPGPSCQITGSHCIPENFSFQGVGAPIRGNNAPVPSLLPPASHPTPNPHITPGEPVLRVRDV